MQLVEYIGADYINAVEDGEIISAEEYAEMTEFAGLLREGVAALPEAEGKAALVTQSDALAKAIDARAGNTDVKQLAQSIRGTLVGTYGIPGTPGQRAGHGPRPHALPAAVRRVPRRRRTRRWPRRRHAGTRPYRFP